MERTGQRSVHRRALSVDRRLEPLHGAYAIDSDRSEALRLLVALHGQAVASLPDAGREDFAIPNRDELLRATEELTGPWDSGPDADRACRQLTEQEGAVTGLLYRHDELVAAVGAKTDGFVITHGEPHAANTILTASGRVLIDLGHGPRRPSRARPLGGARPAPLNGK